MAQKWFAKISDTIVEDNHLLLSHCRLNMTLGKSLNPDQTTAYDTQECCEADEFIAELSNGNPYLRVQANCSGSADLNREPKQEIHLQNASATERHIKTQADKTDFP